MVAPRHKPSGQPAAERSDGRRGEVFLIPSFRPFDKTTNMTSREWRIRSSVRRTPPLRHAREPDKWHSDGRTGALPTQEKPPYPAVRTKFDTCHKTTENVDKCGRFFVRLFVPDRQKNRFFHRIITHSAYALMLSCGSFCKMIRKKIFFSPHHFSSHHGIESSKNPLTAPMKQ